MINAVYGFASMLLKVWHDLKPSHIAVTFDVAGGTFRHVKYKEYKATRVKADQTLYDQIPLVHELVEAFNIPIYEKKGYEADDVIGTIVEKNKEKGVKSKELEVYIVTGDMDTLQLIRPGVKVYTMRKGMSDIVIYDDNEVKNRYGFGPEFMVDYKALRGDVSDNIPGVTGIGEKTATELINKIGGIDNIYKQLRTQNSELRTLFSKSVMSKLEAGEKDAELSHELATIDTNVPDLNFQPDDCKVKNFDREKIIGLFQKYEFVSLIKRLPGEDGEIQKVTSSKLQVTNSKTITTTEIKTKGEIEKMIGKIKKSGRFACRALLNGTDVFTSELLGLVIVVEDVGYYLQKNLLQQMWQIFIDKNITVVGHDLKQLNKVFLNFQFPISNFQFDVMIASYLLNPGSRAHDVASVVLKTLGKELPAGAGQESLFGFDYKAVANELHLILQCADKLKAELQKIDDYGLFQKVEMPLVSILAEMELNGVAVDLKMLQKLSTEVAKAIKTVSKHIYELSGSEFNISSTQQLREILFDKMQIPSEGIKKGKTGLSTSAEELEKLRDLHPIIPEIENYRELEKLRNTYIDVLPTLINKKTRRIHTSFNQAITATGRLSSSDPNLQNIPIRTELGREIRQAFVAEKDNLLISADYSQIELRIVASLAEDKKMLEIFAHDEDIHKATAAAIHNVPLDKVTKEMRRSAKEINFGILYGMGSYGLSWRAEIPVWQAKEFIAKYFEQFAGVKKYLDQTLEFTKKEGYSETLFGRRRYIPELNSPNFQLRSAAERMAINHPIQGTAADLIKMAMAAIHTNLQTYKLTDCKMILQVHDELVFEVKKELAEEISKIVKETMENVVKLRVPVKVDVNVGKRWGELK